jgi:hypothetical protein
VTLPPVPPAVPPVPVPLPPFPVVPAVPVVLPPVPGDDDPPELQPRAAVIAATSVKPTSFPAGFIAFLSCRFM